MAHAHEAAPQPPIVSPEADATPSLAALRRFARAQPNIERCELCGLALAEVHPHLLERASRNVLCACDACAILFCAHESGRYTRIPRRILHLDDFVFDDLAWESMMLPIHLAFFLRGATGETTAFYPSPAGPMASSILLPAWHELFSGNEALASVEPEVEALLVNRIGHAAYFIVPIDECYRLVGLIRTRWRGLSGGPEVWQAVAGFFSDLERRSIRRGAAHHA